MDCTIYEWETGGHIAEQVRREERRAGIERYLKRAFPMIVDERFIEMLHSLDESPAQAD